MKWLAIILSIVAADRAFAGASNVSVTCDSPKKTVHLEASYPGDMAGSRVVLKSAAGTQAYLDGSAVQDAQLNNQDLQKEFPGGYTVAAIAAVEMISNKVLTLAVVQNDFVVVQVGAIPGTIRIGPVRNGQAGTFSAQLRTSDPSGKTKGISTTVACKYDYTI
jgi:hypothetical protein